MITDEQLEAWEAAAAVDLFEPGEARAAIAALLEERIALLAAARERDRLREAIVVIATTECDADHDTDGHALCPKRVAREALDSNETGLLRARRAQSDRLAKLEAVAEAAQAVATDPTIVERLKRLDDALAALDATGKP